MVTDPPPAEDAPPGPPLPTSYEEARTELAAIVRALETGSQPLEESLALWERGEAVAALCETWLQAARDRLEAAAATGTDGRAAPSDVTRADADRADRDGGGGTR